MPAPSTPAPTRPLVQALWLTGMGILFHFLAQIKWHHVWKGLVYDPILRWWLPLAFFVAAAYVAMGALPQPRLTWNRRFNFQWLLELVLPLAAVLYVRYIDPISYVDDAGFILRYFDHFAEGCFECYNTTDGAVFGISSFVYGLLGGFLTWTHLMSSDGAIHTLTYLGIFATGFLLFKVLRQSIRNEGAIVLMWLLVMTCSRSAMLIFNAGMEAPLHFAILLAALLFFLQRKDRWMWFFLALSVISKLDAVPLVLVIGSFWAIENWADLKQFDWHKKRYYDALYFGLIPILIWLGFATLVFGGPLPQSAYAKVYFQFHAAGSWFPFVEGLMSSAYQSVFLAVALTLFVAQLGFVAARRQGGRSLVFGFAFLATLLLYYFYNPGERMLWYYVLPEGLMLLQLGVSLEWLWGSLPRGRWLVGSLLGVGLCTGMAFMFTWMHAAGDIAYQREYQHTVEGERLRLGDYLAAHVAPDDTLASGHGLIARKVQGYVIDATGLNSKVVTDLKQATDSVHQATVIYEHLRPNWVVMHGYSYEVELLNHFPYVLDTSFFDITTYGYPTWRVFKRVPTIEESEGTYFLQYTEILGKDMEFFPEPTNFLHLKAEAFSFVRQVYNPRESKITVGLLRHEFDYEVKVRDILPGDTTVWEHHYTVGCYEGSGNPRLCPITIPLIRHGIPLNKYTGARYITLEFTNSYGKVALYDPTVSILRRDP